MAKNLLSIVGTLAISSFDGDFKASKDNHPRPRIGKTRRDRENKAHARNADNKMERAAWQQSGSKMAFPAHTCNGYRNRQSKGKTAKK